MIPAVLIHPANAQIARAGVKKSILLQLSAVVQKEGRFYTAWCAELDVASQGESIEAALENLKEAVELYLEDKEALQIEGAPMITTIEVRRGKASRPVRG